ncbi:MAG: transglutaminase-like domain-containing protein, partial [Candidatus Eisenbacteria bacterium]
FYQRRDWSDANTYWRDIATLVRGGVDSRTGDASLIAATARDIVAGATDDRSRAQRLVRWCRREILPTSEAQDEQRFRNDLVPSISEVIETRLGREEDAARVLVALARAAGLQAEQVVFESRNWLPLQKGIMTALPLEYEAVRLRGDGLDALCRPRATGVAWNELHARVDGMQGLVCSAAGVEFVPAPVRDVARLERQGEFHVSPTGDVEGALQVRLTGAWAESWLERTRDRSRSEDVLREIQRLRDEGAKLTGVTASVAGADSDTVTVRAQLRWPGYATITGKRLLLQPGLWAARAPALFPSESRNSAIVFPFAWQESDSLVFHLPEGHGLDPGEPQPAFEAETILRHDARLAGASPGGRQLTWVRHLAVADPAKTSYSRSLYPDLRRAFQTVAERDQAMIAATKASP